MNLQFFKKNFLIIIAIVIHLSFYVSYFLQTDSLIYPPNHYHLNYKGLDFFQVPKSAYAFWNFKTFNAGIDDYFGVQKVTSNRNVYHPFFTLAFGSPFLLFSPNIAFEVWIYIKAFLWILTGIYLWQSFKNHPYRQWALFFFAANFTLGLDIRIGQFQALLNLALLWALLHWFKGNRPYFTLAYVASLVIKPAAILWLAVLFIRRHYKIVFEVLLITTVVTVPFLWNNLADYYFANLKRRIFTDAVYGFPDILTLNAFFKNLGVKLSWLFTLKMVVVSGSLALAFFRRISSFTLFYLLCLHGIFFDQMIYEYHYSIVIPFFVTGVLFVPSLQKPFARFIMVWAQLPSCYFLFKITHNPHLVAGMIDGLIWRRLLALRLLPLCILAIYLLACDLQSGSGKKKEKWGELPGLIL